jgi:hypothetical protein
VLDEDWRAKAIWGGGKMILHRGWPKAQFESNAE